MNKIVEFEKLGLRFEFNNIIQIGSFSITIYGILIALGLGVALIYAFKNLKRFGVNEDKMVNCIIGGIAGSIIGARLYYVIFSWSDFGFDFSSWSTFWNSLVDIFSTWEGGMAIYGGIIGALAVGLLIAKIHKMPFGPVLDVAGIGFLIGQCIGRWGNFVNVEAFGSNTTLPWGMSSPSISSYLNATKDSLGALGVSIDPSMPVHPTFLYESLWCLLGFFLLHFYSKHRKFDGEVFLMYLGYYGLGRVVIEGLRTDSLMIGYLRVSQVLAALLVVVSVITIIIIRSKIKGNNDPEYRKLYVNSQAWLDYLDEKNSKASDYDSTDDFIDENDGNDLDSIDSDDDFESDKIEVMDDTDDIDDIEEMDSSDSNDGTNEDIDNSDKEKEINDK